MRLSECPVRVTAKVIGGKWKPLILQCLKSGTQRYGQLRRQVPEASKKVLTAHLRELENAGILARRVSGKNSLRVEYSFTPYGKTLVPILGLMADWGKRHSKMTGDRV